MGFDDRATTANQLKSFRAGHGTSVKWVHTRQEHKILE